MAWPTRQSDAPRRSPVAVAISVSSVRFKRGPFTRCLFAATASIGYTWTARFQSLVDRSASQVFSIQSIGNACEPGYTSGICHSFHIGRMLHNLVMLFVCCSMVSLGTVMCRYDQVEQQGTKVSGPRKEPGKHVCVSVETFPAVGPSLELTLG